MNEDYPIADWSGLAAEPDLRVPLPGGGAMLFRRIPTGSFLMGTRGGAANEEPRHRVVLPQNFYLGNSSSPKRSGGALLSPKLTEAPGLDPSNERNKASRRPVTMFLGTMPRYGAGS